MSAEPLESVRFVPASRVDRDALAEMARRAFSDTFAARFPPEPFAAFLEGAYGPGGTMATDLQDPAIRWLVAIVGAVVVGYAKLTPLRAPAPEARPAALELQQIYVLSGWHGRGVADRLMQWALTTAAESRAPEIYLTVFDHNERAKRFYCRHGFAEVGHATFTLGDRSYDDRIWGRTLS